VYHKRLSGQDLSKDLAVTYPYSQTIDFSPRGSLEAVCR